MKEISIATSLKTQLIDITGEISKVVKAAEIKDGILQVFVPHTTAGITINEGADPDVKDDIITTLNKLIPFGGKYRHLEGNAPAHIKASNLLDRGWFNETFPWIGWSSRSKASTEI